MVSNSEAAERLAAFREFVQAGQLQLWPKTHRWLHPKRIIPPHGYWSDTEIAAETELTFFHSLFYPESGTVRETFNIYRTIVELARHEFPTWHVGSALVHALLRTSVPTDWPVERFKMPFSAIRLVFEKGSFVLENGTEVVALQGLVTDPSHLLRLPPEIAEELSSLDRDPALRSNAFIARQAQRARTAVADLERAPAPSGSELVLVAWRTPAVRGKFGFSLHDLAFDATLGDLLNHQVVASPENDAGGFRPREPADQKRAIIENMLPLFLNAVLLLTAKPEYVEGGGLARPATKKGNRTLEALYHPRFLGKKFAYQRGSTTDRTLPGRKLPPGWRAGHWKDIPYGPNRVFRRHDWIEPYQYGLNGENDEPATAAPSFSATVISSPANHPRCSQHVGHPGETVMLVLYLRKVSPTPDEDVRQYLFEDDSGNVFTMRSSQRMEFRLGEPAAVRAKIVRHYLGGKECRTEITRLDKG